MEGKRQNRISEATCHCAVKRKKRKKRKKPKKKPIPQLAPRPEFLKRKTIADDRRFSSDAEVRPVLVALRGGESEAVSAMYDGLEWLIYDFVPPDKHQFGLKIIYNDEYFNIAYVAMTVVVDRLRRNELWKLNQIEKHVKDEFARAFKEEKKKAWHDIYVPYSTNSTRAKTKGANVKHRSLYKRIATRLRGARGDDDAPLDFPYESTKGCVGQAGPSISTATETTLDDPTVASSGSRRNLARPGAYTPATNQSGGPIDSPDIPAYKRDPSGGKRRLCNGRSRRGIAPRSGPDLLLRLTRLKLSRFYGCQQPLHRQCDCGSTTALVFAGKCADCYTKAHSKSGESRISLTMHLWGQCANELAADRRIDLASPTILACRIGNLNREYRYLLQNLKNQREIQAPADALRAVEAKLQVIRDKREQLNARLGLERWVNARILELADAGWSVNVIGAFIAFRELDAGEVERRIERIKTGDTVKALEDEMRTTWAFRHSTFERLWGERWLNNRILELADAGSSANLIGAMLAAQRHRSGDIEQRIESMRKQARQLSYHGLSCPVWDYSSEQFVADETNKLDRPCANGCGRPARCPKCGCLIACGVTVCRACGCDLPTDGHLLCWPCYYMQECPRTCRTAADGRCGDREYYCAQPANAHNLPLLSDAQTPIRPGSLGFPIPKEVRRTLRLDAADKGNSRKSREHKRKRA